MWGKLNGFGLASVYHIIQWQIGCHTYGRILFKSRQCKNELWMLLEVSCIFVCLPNRTNFFVPDYFQDVSFGYGNKILKTEWLKMQKWMSQSSPSQKSKINMSVGPNAFWRLLRKICSLYLLAFGDYWHDLSFGHLTPNSVSMSTWPSPLFVWMLPLHLSYKNTCYLCI